MGEVRDQVDPPSLVYFAKVAEMEQWVAGDQVKRGRLEKRWRQKYDDHRKATGVRQKAAAQVPAGDGS